MQEKVPNIIEGFTHTEYLTVFSAIIFGYVGAEYFQGWGSIIKNRDHIRIYWQHLLWTIFAFIMFIQNWWGIWPRTAAINESIFFFIYSLIPIFLFYLISVILFPDFKKHEQVDLKDYFYKNTRWLFSLFAVYFVLTIISSFVYDDIGNVFVQNIIRAGGVLLAATAAYFNKKVWLHTVFLALGYYMLIQFFLALPT
ncbi:hypothetical protein JMN32_01275 [Fulvivirga sp. 29W222]|uniref:Uncharacterized protein n=1 Tax=Fulvivirga marina TaxID=2494733 RepID=A0A937KCF7_9BACT|nr:hypothetical protein [Fulvivirga marina]MBL6444920.1 hypothetical protein [Fulvivirga marina]